MKLNVIQLRDNIYFETIPFLECDVAQDFADEIITYFYTKPKVKETFMIEVGKTMKKYKLRDSKLREYILECYRWFCEK